MRRRKGGGNMRGRRIKKMEGVAPLRPFLDAPGEPPVPWDDWFESFQSYMIVVDGDSLPIKKRVALLLHCLGVEGRRIYNNLPKVEESMEIMDDLKFQNLVKFLHDHFAPNVKKVTNHAEESNQRIVSPVRKIIQDSYMDGFKELVSDGLNCYLKVLWFIILMINLSLMLRQLYPIAIEFSEQCTITKVDQVQANMSQINHPSVCFKLSEHHLYRYSQNGSGSVEIGDPIASESLLLLGYIKAMIPLFAHSGLWLTSVDARNLTWKEFALIMSRPSLAMDSEEASISSQTALYDVLSYWGIRPITFAPFPNLLQFNFSYVNSFYSDILSASSENDTLYDTAICRPIQLTSYVESTLGGKAYYFKFGYYVAVASRPNIPNLEYGVTHFNPKVHGIDIASITITNTEEENKLVHNNYILVPTKYKYLDLRKRRCHSPGQNIYPRGYGKTICYQECVWKRHATLFGCTFWEDLNSSDQPTEKVCHVFYILNQVRSQMSDQCMNNNTLSWCDNGTVRPMKEWSQLILQTYKDYFSDNASLPGNCATKCENFTFCEEWELESRFLEKHVYRVNLMNATFATSNWTGFMSNSLYSISNVISVNEEVLKISLEQFASDLGGTFTFYFGSSLCGCFHLFFLLIINGVARIFDRRRIRGTRSDTAETGLSVRHHTLHKETMMKS